MKKSKILTETQELITDEICDLAVEMGRISKEIKRAKKQLKRFNGSDEAYDDLRFFLNDYKSDFSYVKKELKDWSDRAWCDLNSVWCDDEDCRCAFNAPRGDEDWYR